MRNYSINLINSFTELPELTALSSISHNFGSWCYELA